MNEPLLSVLVCPRCGGSFRWEPVASSPAWGILACAHHRYPVLEEIPVLRQDPQARAAAAAIDRGEFADALGALLAPARHAPADRLLGQVRAYLLRSPAVALLTVARAGAGLHGDAAVPSFREQNRALHGRKSRGAPALMEYITFRRSDPSFVAGEALAGVLLPREGAVLDLSRDAGHLAASLGELAEGRLVVGVEDLFGALLLGRRFIAPHAALVCAESGAPLPFRDGAFGMAVCAGPFHRFPYLPMAAREVARVLSRSDGIACLTGLGLGATEGDEGCRGPLGPAEYAEALAPLGVRFGDEREVLTAALGAGPRSLTLGRAPEQQDAAPGLLAVGGAAAPPEVSIAGPVLPIPVGPTIFNPLYDRTSVDAAEGSRVLRRSSFRYPSESGAGPIEGFLPDTVRVPLAFEASGAAAEAAPDLLGALLVQRVVMTLPAGMVEPEGPLPGGRTRAPAAEGS